MTRHIRHGIIIHTAYYDPPIPSREWDWSAIEDSYEPGYPVGSGRTEEEAIADLLEQLEDREPEPQWDGDRS